MFWWARRRGMCERGRIRSALHALADKAIPGQMNIREDVKPRFRPTHVSLSGIDLCIWSGRPTMEQVLPWRAAIPRQDACASWLRSGSLRKCPHYSRSTERVLARPVFGFCGGIVLSDSTVGRPVALDWSVAGAVGPRHPPPVTIRLQPICWRMVTTSKHCRG